MIDNIEFLLRVVVILLVIPTLFWTATRAWTFARGDYSPSTVARSFGFFSSLVMLLYTLRNMLLLHNSIALIFLLLGLKIVTAGVGIFWWLVVRKTAASKKLTDDNLKNASERLREEFPDAG